MKYTGHPTAFLSEKKFKKNVKKIIQKLGQGAQLFPVLKADAYGHCAVGAARILEKHFSKKTIPMVCVARVAEAKELLKSGFKRDVLILSDVSDLSLLSQSEKSKVQVVLSSFDDFKKISNMQKTRFRFHVDINTGMNRLGLNSQMTDSQLGLLKKSIQKLESKGHRWVGLMSHLACGDEDPQGYSAFQEDRFKDFLRRIKPTEEIIIHLSNSSGHFQGIGRTFCDAVRVGIHLWGFSVLDSKLDESYFENVMSVAAPLRQLQLLKKGESAGYARAFVAQEPSLLGIFQLGYADGFRRDFPNQKIGIVVEGEWMPVVGRVSIDLVHVDLTRHSQKEKWLRWHLKNKTPQTLGYWIHEKQSVQELAKKLNTIPYEIVCGVGCRIQRVWVP